MGIVSFNDTNSSSLPQYSISSSSAAAINAKIDNPLTLEQSSFLTANGINSPFPSSCVEMVSLRPLTYTSLKDLLPPIPTGILASQSWHEIPIKNRLVKQAAWAYLQPMSSFPEPDDQSFCRWLRVRCSGECGRNCVDGCGCFGFINEQVVPRIRRAFARIFGAIPCGENSESETVRKKQ